MMSEEAYEDNARIIAAAEKLNNPSRKPFGAPSGSGALDKIAKERRRQKRRGYGMRHDDTHTDKALIRNAIDVLQSYLNTIFAPPPGTDQWGLGTKHHGDPKKLLAVAGGLVVAEYERIVRAQKRPNKELCGASASESATVRL